MLRFTVAVAAFVLVLHSGRADDDVGHDGDNEGTVQHRDLPTSHIKPPPPPKIPPLHPLVVEYIYIYSIVDHMFRLTHSQIPSCNAIPVGTAPC